MKPPKAFYVKDKQGYSLCNACEGWHKNNIFRHDGRHWILCRDDYEDYWYNTDELLLDYKGY